jgi:hypothetical protein
VSAVTVRYFTDPACPPDPARTRLRWQYGDQIAWELRMIVVGDATIHACRAVVGTRLRWPDREELMLRHLQLLAAAGELLDISDTLEMAAAKAGLPVAELAAYCAEPEVEAALRADMAIAAGRQCGEIAGDLAGLTRRADPASADEVVRWADMPLTDAEVAALMNKSSV